RGYKVYYRGTGPQGIAPIWFQGNPATFAAFNGPSDGYVGSNFNSVTGVNTIDNWLVLPALSVQTGDSLVFWSRSPDNSPFPDSIRVMYSAAGDSVPEATTWTELGRFRVSTSGWQRRSFRAPSAGSTGRFAIRYAVANGGPSGANSNYIGIDALTVERVAATPTFAATPASANFGAVNVGGSSAPQSFSLGNAGQGSLTITGISLTGADASQFTLTNTNTLPANLGATQNITVSVTFNPTSVGAKSASLQVTYTGATGSPVSIPLTGSGFIPAQVAILADTTSASLRISRDTLISYLNATGRSFDVIQRGGNTATITIPSLSPYQFVFLLGEGTNTASPNTRTALRNYLQNGTISNKARLIIFAEDFGYNHDRAGATARDTILTRELLGVQYHADRPASGAAQRLINVGLGIADSVDGTWPEVFRAVRPNTTVLYRFATFPVNADTVSSIGRNEAGYASAVFGFDLRRYRAAYDSPPLASESVGAAFTRLLESATFFVQTGVALPVELVSFTGEVRDGAVHLAWRTASELNNAGFEVERKSQGGSWNTLGFVRGAGTTTEAQSYTFVDNSASGTVQYRLKQVDFDGQFEYSNIIEVNAGLPKTFALEQNYPNPFNPTTVIAYQLPVASEVKLEVYDVLGRKVMTLVNGRQNAGAYNFTLNAGNLSSGVYFYRLQASATNGASSSNFVATKKMMLIK
ncbi:MAG: choice-of-anchor J domain-containing protein, partial [Chloroherpetonaceae bacterium]